MDSNTKKCFVDFVKTFEQEYKLAQNYNIIFTYNRNDIKTNAYYDPQNKLIKVYIKNRELADVLRSIAHELVHYWQDSNNMLSSTHQDVGGKIENEANAKAGSFVKQFGYNHPEYKIYENNC